MPLANCPVLLQFGWRLDSHHPPDFNASNPALVHFHIHQDDPSLWRPERTKRLQHPVRKIHHPPS